MSLSLSSIGETALSDLTMIAKSHGCPHITFQWDATRLWVTDWMQDKSSAFVWQLPRALFTRYECNNEPGCCTIPVSRLSSLVGACGMLFVSEGVATEYTTGESSKFQHVSSSETDYVLHAPQVTPREPEWKSLTRGEMKVQENKCFVTPTSFISEASYQQHTLLFSHKQHWYKDEQTPLAISLSSFLTLWLPLKDNWSIV